MKDGDSKKRSEMEERAVWYKNTWGSPVGQDSINLDGALTQWLGDRLIFLSCHASGTPCEITEDSGPREHANWRGDLHRHGVALQKYDQAGSNPDIEIRERAQEALRWVADHLGDLWD